MSSLPRVQRTADLARRESVDGLLAEIIERGARPRLSLHADGTWTAAVEVPVPGSTLVATAMTHNHARPQDALRAILEEAFPS